MSGDPSEPSIDPAHEVAVIEPLDASMPIDPRVAARARRRERVARAMLFVAALAILLVARGLTAHPTADIPVRNFDENLMYTSAMSIWTGGPGSVLGWPGGASRLAVWVSVPVLFAIENRHHLSADAFVVFLGHELREPWRMIGVMRWWSIVLSSVGFAFLPLLLLRFTTSRALALAIGVAAACTGPMWVRSVMSTGDAVGWATAVVAIWLALRARESPLRWHRWAALAALFAGLAIGSRTTAVFIWPVMFVASIRSARTFAQTIALWLVLPAIGFYLLSPYAFTDPVRLLKHTIGNLLVRPPSMPWTTALLVAAPVPWLIAATLGVPFALVRRRHAWLVVATLWTLAMFAMAIRGTRMIEPHYLAPLIVPLAMLSAIVCERFTATRRVAASAFAGVVLVGGLAYGVLEAHRASVEGEDSYGGGQRLARFLEAQDFRGRIAYDGTTSAFFLAKLETDASIGDRVALHERQLERGESGVVFLRRSGLSERVARGLADQFNDADRILIANGRPQAQVGKTAGLTLLLVEPEEDFLAARQGFNLTRRQAVDELIAGRVDAIVVQTPIAGPLPPFDFGGQAGRRTLMYVRDGSPLATAAAAWPGVTRAAATQPAG